MSTRVLCCKQQATNSINLTENNNSWINIFDQPVTLEKNSTLRVNYCFLNTNSKTNLIKIIEDVNNTFKITYEYYFMRDFWDVQGDSDITDPYTFTPIYYDGSPYTNTVSYTIPSGFYTVDQIADEINAQMVNSSFSEFTDGSTRVTSVTSDTWKLFPSSEGYSLYGISNANNEAMWPSELGGSYYTYAGANQPVFSYSPQESRYIFTFLHTPYYGADGQPAVLVNGYTNLGAGDQSSSSYQKTLPPYVNKLSGVWITLENDLAQGWTTLGFDATQLGSRLNASSDQPGTTSGKLLTSFYNTCAITTPQSTYQAESDTQRADNLPILNSTPYWLLQTDLITDKNYLNPDQNGFISCSGIISGNFNSGNYIFSYDNSYDISVDETKTITSIRTTILNPDGTVPELATLENNSSVIYELISPPQV